MSPWEMFLVILCSASLASRSRSAGLPFRPGALPSDADRDIIADGGGFYNGCAEGRGFSAFVGGSGSALLVEVELDVDVF